MNFEKLIGTFFDIKELEDPYQDVMGIKGVKRMIILGFIIGFLVVNLGSAYLLGDTGVFIIPTGLSGTRLVFITFLLQFLYHQFDADKIIEVDERYGLNYVYIPEKHEDYVVKQY